MGPDSLRFQDRVQVDPLDVLPDLVNVLLGHYFVIVLKNLIVLH